MARFPTTEIDILLAFVIFSFGWFYFSFLALRFRIRVFDASVLYVWHSLLGILYFLYALNNPSDAGTYYSNRLTPRDGYYGSALIEMLISVLYRVTGLSFLGMFSVFNIVGVTGLLLIYRSAGIVLGSCLKDYYKVIILFLFVPGISFWTSAPGKDSIVFVLICWFFYLLIRQDKSRLWLVIPIILVTVIRPHIGVLMFLSVAGGMFFGYRMNGFKRAAFLVFTGPVALLSVNYFLAFSGITPSLSGVLYYLEDRGGYVSSGTGAVQSNNLATDIVYYLFGPLPFQMGGSLGLFAGIENMLLLLLVLYLFLKGDVVSAVKQRPDLVLFVISGVLVLSQVNYNFAIGLRQKWMVFPALFLILIYGVSVREKKRSSCDFNRH